MLTNNFFFLIFFIVLLCLPKKKKLILEFTIYLTSSILLLNLRKFIGNDHLTLHCSKLKLINFRILVTKPLKKKKKNTLF